MKESIRRKDFTQYDLLYETLLLKGFNRTNSDQCLLLQVRPQEGASYKSAFHPLLLSQGLTRIGKHSQELMRSDKDSKIKISLEFFHGCDWFGGSGFDNGGTCAR